MKNTLLKIVPIIFLGRRVSRITVPRTVDLHRLKCYMYMYVHTTCMFSGILSNRQHYSSQLPIRHKSKFSELSTS